MFPFYRDWPTLKHNHLSLSVLVFQQINSRTDWSTFFHVSKSKTTISVTWELISIFSLVIWLFIEILEYLYKLFWCSVCNVWACVWREGGGEVGGSVILLKYICFWWLKAFVILLSSSKCEKLYGCVSLSASAIFSWTVSSLPAAYPWRGRVGLHQRQPHSRKDC